MAESDENKDNKTNFPKRKRKNSENADLSNMSNEDLQNEVRRLNKHVFQLKVLLDRAMSKDTNESPKEAKPQRGFDFNKYNKRHILLKFAYLGWNYDGYITQEDSRKTVEDFLFNALIKAKLIESRQTSNYHRCGRTDKGVSAFSQVISIDCRSNCSEGVGVIVNPQSTVKNTDIENEINYVKLLNGILPPEMRIIGWAPCEPQMSSRFDCDGRSYRYYFPKGDLDIDLMSIAAQKLVGEHDYRNFCRMDVGNGVVTFTRSIDKVSLEILDTEPKVYSMVEFMITGSSFLWHQIRSVMAILFLVGQKKELPSIVDDLLDINKWPCKPEYNISSELPLVLFDSHYIGVEWICDKADFEKLIKSFQDMWLTDQTKASVIKRMVDHLEIEYDKKDASHAASIEDNSKCSSDSKNKKNDNVRNLNQPYFPLLGKTTPLTYTKLENRRTANSLEDRLDYFIKRKRIDKEYIEERIAYSQSLSKQNK